ncbi:MAG: hypothetical protein KGJ90_04955 [Patescibacteria group bacterium]|nr:hypothetical protein [Patescibacteria group bacterium]
MKTLLEKAKSEDIKGIRHIGKEELDISLAWIRGEITLSQVERAVFGKSGGVGGYVILARSLKEAYKQKKIK